jgi:hypothetical protein
MSQLFVVSGVRCNVDEFCPLLGYYAASSGKGLPLDAKGLPLDAALHPRRGKSQLVVCLFVCLFVCLLACLLAFFVLFPSTFQLILAG